MKRLAVLITAAALAFPAPALPAGAALPVPPQQMFEAMQLYIEQGDFDKAGRILEKMVPLLDELKTAYGTDLYGETRLALKKNDAWEAQSAVLKVVYFHMKSELSRAIVQSGRSAAVAVRVAYLDYLFLAPRVSRKNSGLAGEAERRFKAVYELVSSGRAGPEREKETWAHVREIERICLLALETG
ncbi:MAG: hypothetical protein M0011_11385 [Elusimicrobia bacterium]|nr:hypothetical protein [Elusimicrobiota bacterium]